MSKNIFPDLNVAAVCTCMQSKANNSTALSCLCEPDERVIHNYQRGLITTPMTPEQRAWCKNEIIKCMECAPEVEEIDAMNDQQIAQQVLEAWLEYVRDKMGY